MTEKVENQEEKSLEEVVDNYEESIIELDETHKQVNDTLDKITEDQKELAQSLANRESELFKKEVAHELKSNGLEAFSGIVNVSTHKELQATVDALKAIVNDIKASSGYIPKENAKQDEFDLHTQNKDTKSMIGSKLANLFKTQN